MHTESSRPLLRLLQLSSVSLPVGGYAFSQGLEFAVEAGWVCSIDTTRDWLATQLEASIARVDLPILARIHNCLTLVDGEISGLEKALVWNDYALACRESKELLSGDIAMGKALARVLQHQSVPFPSSATSPSFLFGFGLTSIYWGIDIKSAQLGYTWSWLENQVAAATKLVPLGQTQAQQLLTDLQENSVEAIDVASHLHDADIGSALPALALASAYHETQYSRLFRS